MKKNIIFFLLTILITICINLNVNAESFNVSLKCDKTETFPEDIVVCDVMPSGNKNTIINNLYGEYNFGKYASYIKFIANEKWDNVTIDSKGFYLHSDSGMPTDVSYGKIYLRINKRENYSGKNGYTVSISMKTNQYKEYLTGSQNVSAQFLVNSKYENRLETVTINNGAIALDFNPDTTEYKLTTSEENIKIALTTKNTSSITDVKSSYALNPGENKIEINVTSSEANFSKVKKYTFIITRSNEKSDDNNLSSLEVCGQKIKINPNITEYSVNVGNDVSMALIWYKTNDSNAKVKINGDTNLLIGRNIFTVDVTSEKGKTKTYTIYVTRAEKNLSTNNLISKIEIEGYSIGFNKNTNDYKLKIKKNVKELKINVIKDEETSNVQIIGNSDLKDGSIIIINVTSENGEINTYTITVDKSDNSMSNLVTLLIFVIILLVIAIIFVIKWKGKSNNINDYKNTKTKSNVLIE